MSATPSATNDTEGTGAPGAPGATKSRPLAPPRAADGGGALAGTRTLFRFALRRDRVRLPVWVLALFLGTASSVSSFDTSYDTAKKRADIAETMDSPAGLAMTGPRHYLDDYNVGSMTGHQMLGFTAVLVGIMSVLIISRHTRTEEETNRAELVRSGVVGRHSYLAAALGVAVVANVALGLLLAAGMSGMGVDGVDGQGALLYGLAHTAIGIFFAAVAAITVQITAYARGASGMAMAVIGAAYALRAAGDVGNDWVSWLSPIGWVQRTYVFVDNRWWPLLLVLAAAVGCAAAGFFLSTRRDVGAGLRAARLGSPVGSEGLTTPLGFALRLHRGLLAGFGAGALLLGVMYGSILGDAEEMIEGVDELEEQLAEVGGANVAESFASVVMIVLAVVCSIYVVMAALRPRAEESAGRAEPLLATALSRDRWVLSHTFVGAVGGTALILLAGIGFGASGAASTGDGGLFLKLVGAALAFAPALWVTIGLAVALFGWFPRAVAAAWVVPVYGFVVDYLGEILKFPDILGDLSPFGHIPQLPAQDMSWPPLLVLTAIAVGLVWLGLLGFRRRDLETK
ncbi:ABC transporter permease [Streptomyces sp. NPDC004134]|uniref:ABC transporter permease n=1 Tax=Streptomyces sp. NPDC004134 TaxID=3364691 RepID=UPI0036C82809